MVAPRFGALSFDGAPRDGRDVVLWCEQRFMVIYLLSAEQTRGYLRVAAAIAATASVYHYRHVLKMLQLDIFFSPIDSAEISLEFWVGYSCWVMGASALKSLIGCTMAINRTFECNL